MAMDRGASMMEVEKKARIFFKRDELNHTGSHKINNCLGQILLALRMGKTRIIAETGAGQHGVASATVAALLGLDCIVYMGAEDVQRHFVKDVTHVHLGEWFGATAVRANVVTREELPPVTVFWGISKK